MNRDDGSAEMMGAEILAVTVFTLLGLVQLPGALGYIDVNSPGWAWVMFTFCMGIALVIAGNAFFGTIS